MEVKCSGRCSTLLKYCRVAQGYWTPPEDEVQIPSLPDLDEAALRHAPPQLLRGRLKDTTAWLAESGAAVSDILVEREEAGRYSYPPPIPEYSNLSILDRPPLSPIQQSPGEAFKDV